MIQTILTKQFRSHIPPQSSQEPTVKGCLARSKKYGAFRRHSCVTESWWTQRVLKDPDTFARLSREGVEHSALTVLNQCYFMLFWFILKVLIRESDSYIVAHSQFLAKTTDAVMPGCRGITLGLAIASATSVWWACVCRSVFLSWAMQATMLAATYLRDRSWSGSWVFRRFCFPPQF